MKDILFLISTICSVVSALNVMNMMDGVELNVNEYIEIQNFNDATYLNKDTQDLNQTLLIDIVIIPLTHNNVDFNSS